MMRCNRCHRLMNATTAYDGACECGGLIEASGCTWEPDADGVWITGCDNNAFVFETDGPKENGFSFCPYCGRALAIRARGSRRSWGGSSCCARDKDSLLGARASEPRAMTDPTPNEKLREAFRKYDEQQEATIQSRIRAAVEAEREFYNGQMQRIFDLCSGVAADIDGIASCEHTPDDLLDLIAVRLREVAPFVLAAIRARGDSDE